MHLLISVPGDPSWSGRRARMILQQWLRLQIQIRHDAVYTDDALYKSTDLGVTQGGLKGVYVYTCILYVYIYVRYKCD